MRLFDCRACGKTKLLGPKRGRLPKLRIDCRRLNDVARYRARDMKDKAMRRALRNTDCLDCKRPMARDDSGKGMDTRLYCPSCISRREHESDERYNRKKGPEADSRSPRKTRRKESSRRISEGNPSYKVGT